MPHQLGGVEVGVAGFVEGDVPVDADAEQHQVDRGLGETRRVAGDLRLGLAVRPDPFQGGQGCGGQAVGEPGAEAAGCARSRPR